jgi:hypothetical protein
MALKHEIAALSEVHESIHDSYEKQGDKFVLKGFVPAEKVEDVGGLKSALQKERENSKKAAKELEALRSTLGDDFNPEEFKTLKEEKTKSEQERAAKAGEFDKLKVQLLDQHSKELDKRKQREQTLLQVLTVERIDKEAALVCSELKASAALLMPHIRSMTKLVEEDGQFHVRVLDAQGNPRVDAKGQFLGVRELLTEMRSNDVYSGAFAGTGKSGGGSAGGDGNGGGGGKPNQGDLKRSTMDVAAKATYIREHGTEEYMKLPF